MKHRLITQEIDVGEGWEQFPPLLLDCLVFLHFWICSRFVLAKSLLSGERMESLRGGSTDCGKVSGLGHQGEEPLKC